MAGGAPRRTQGVAQQGPSRERHCGWRCGARLVEDGFQRRGLLSYHHEHAVTRSPGGRVVEQGESGVAKAGVVLVVTSAGGAVDAKQRTACRDDGRAQWAEVPRADSRPGPGSRVAAAGRCDTTWSVRPPDGQAKRPEPWSAGAAPMQRPRTPPERKLGRLCHPRPHGPTVQPRPPAGAGDVRPGRRGGHRPR